MAIIITSWIVGVNFVRLIWARVFGTESTSSDLNTHYFFVKPLNNLANFTLIFNGLGIIQSIVVLFQLTIGYDAWALAVFTMAGDCGLVLFSNCKDIPDKEIYGSVSKTAWLTNLFNRFNT